MRVDLGLSQEDSNHALICVSDMERELDMNKGVMWLVDGFFRKNVGGGVN